jgi:hypothetical protein
MEVSGRGLSDTIPASAWTEENHKNRTAGIPAETWTRDLQNKTQECCPVVIMSSEQKHVLLQTSNFM